MFGASPPPTRKCEDVWVCARLGPSLSRLAPCAPKPHTHKPRRHWPEMHTIGHSRTKVALDRVSLADPCPRRAPPIWVQPNQRPATSRMVSTMFFGRLLLARLPTTLMMT